MTYNALLAVFGCVIMLFAALGCLAFALKDKRKEEFEKKWKRYNTGVWKSCQCGQAGCEICYPMRHDNN